MAERFAGKARSLPTFHQPVGLLAHEHRAQVMHGQQKRVGDFVKLVLLGASLRPVGGQVQVVDGAAGLGVAAQLAAIPVATWSC